MPHLVRVPAFLLTLSLILLACAPSGTGAPSPSITALSQPPAVVAAALAPLRAAYTAASEAALTKLRGAGTDEAAARLAYASLVSAGEVYAAGLTTLTADGAIGLALQSLHVSLLALVSVQRQLAEGPASTWAANVGPYNQASAALTSAMSTLMAALAAATTVASAGPATAAPAATTHAPTAKPAPSATAATTGCSAGAIDQLAGKFATAAHYIATAKVTVASGTYTERFAYIAPDRFETDVYGAGTTIAVAIGASAWYATMGADGALAWQTVPAAQVRATYTINGLLAGLPAPTGAVVDTSNGCVITANGVVYTIDRDGRLAYLRAPTVLIGVDYGSPPTIKPPTGP